MASLKRAMKRLGSMANLNSINTDVQHLPSPASTQPPQVNLPHVDTQLNMHQVNGLFEDGSPAADGLRGRFTMSMASATFPRALLTRPGVIPSTDSHGSPTQPQSQPQSQPQPQPQSQPQSQPQPPNPSSGNPTSPADETPTEWSAVGHAATGKSGRVIHNLQEEIARLRRECSVYRSRAEETQRSNETLKTQAQNMSERLRNLEQVNEVNLNSITRKDRKIEDLRVEIQNERNKRKEAESAASKTNDMMRDEREHHNREQAEAQELTKYHQTQYEVLASATKREKTDLGRRVKVLFDELKSLKGAHEKHVVSSDHLEVIAEQKNREIEGLKELHEKLLDTHVQYKKFKDDELRDTLEQGRAYNAQLETMVASMKETEGKMNWVMRLQEMRDQEGERRTEKEKA
ncbi:hypothetical protein N7481_000379 [Penicillium waksmanii]|uniref:uncharacterized protein n=1 Tax=Penicillium waksmanii TaxID=69791 RepID=UPI0025498F5C|nr:uncharacterized protein N7481_000379 [Penicillium waksmanii]KAJ5999970.1 hypothetical protein N7481_000379 [Penicillium waksmanii]